MALHAPSHHLPHIHTENHRLLRDLLVALAIAIAVLLVFGTALVVRPTIPAFWVAQPQTPPLVEFRAGERASWAESQTTEAQSILLFRAAERAER
jgi:hypothetical protein